MLINFFEKYSGSLMHFATAGFLLGESDRRSIPDDI